MLKIDLVRKLIKNNSIDGQKSLIDNDKEFASLGFDVMSEEAQKYAARTMDFSDKDFVTLEIFKKITRCSKNVQLSLINNRTILSEYLLVLIDGVDVQVSSEIKKAARDKFYLLNE